MNERGKAALINAAMRGVRQIRYNLYDGVGFCAGGVLMQDLGLFESLNFETWANSWAKCQSEFAMTVEEWDLMVDMNNSGADFLKIARELPDTE